MASSKRTKNGTRTKRPVLNFFFLNGDLYRKLEINYGRDTLVAWNYPKGKRSTFNYTDVLRSHEKAFTSAQVSQMLNRSRLSLSNAIQDGMIERPQFTYTLDENRRMHKYLWSEKDILAALEYFASLGRGRPRKDGRLTSASDLPTPREVRAMIHHEGEALGVMRDGIFVPTYRAKEF